MKRESPSNHVLAYLEDDMDTAVMKCTVEINTQSTKKWKNVKQRVQCTSVSKTCERKGIKSKKKAAPNVGLEPTTLRLRVSCSTD